MTTFIRVLEAAVDEKGADLKTSIEALRQDAGAGNRPHPAVFECQPTQFSQVPGSPFAYWVSEAVRCLYRQFAPLESRERRLSIGASTKNDFRYVRASVPSQ